MGVLETLFLHREFIILCSPIHQIAFIVVLLLSDDHGAIQVALRGDRISFLSVILPTSWLEKLSLFQGSGSNRCIQKGSWESSKQHGDRVERHPQRDQDTSKTAVDDPHLEPIPRDSSYYSVRILDSASESPSPTLGKRPCSWEPYKYFLGALDLGAGISFRRDMGGWTPN